MTARLRRAAAGVALLAVLGVPAAASAAPSRYGQAVMADRPMRYARLHALADGQAPDVTGSAAFAFDAGEGVTAGGPGSGAPTGDPDRAFTFSGASALSGHAPPLLAAPYPMPAANHPYLGYTHFTLEAWVKPGFTDQRTRRIISSEDEHGGVLLGVKGGEIVFSRYVTAGRQLLWAIQRDDTTPFPTGGVVTDVPQTVWSTVRAPFARGRWTHVVGVYEIPPAPAAPEGVMRLYVDGRLTGSAASGMLPLRSINAQTPPAIGSNRTGWLRYDGQIDEVAVYISRPLTAARVAEHYRLATTAG